MEVKLEESGTDRLFESDRQSESEEVWFKNTSGAVRDRFESERIPHNRKAESMSARC